MDASLRKAILIPMLCVSTASAIPCQPCHGITQSSLASAALTNSGKYNKLREKTNRNDAPDIDRFLTYVGLDNKAEFKRAGSGYSWCAAFVLMNYKEAADALKVPQPLPRTAGVANLWRITRANPIRYRTFTTDQVRLGLIKLLPGDIVIWKHGAKAFQFGHTGLHKEQYSLSRIGTREGNTSEEGSSGSQSNGGGVFDRVRYLAPNNSFSIIGFIRAK